jgi:hypothetical protein
MNGKKLTGWSAVLAAIAAAIVAARGGHHHPTPPTDPPPVPTYTLNVHVCDGTPCVEGDEHHKVPGATVLYADDKPAGVTDGSGNVDFPGVSAGSYRVCARADGYKETCADSALPAGGSVFLVLTVDVPPIVPLRADGRIFRQGDQPWRWKGVSAFQLLDRFAKGEDLAPFLEAYKGYNLLRVWPYVPRADWGAAAWDAPSPDVTVAFLARVARDGWYVELTLLTDDDPARVGAARQLVAVLAAARVQNLLIEIGNEPQIHKNIDTRALKAALDASGFLYASGDSSDKAFGSYLTAHTGRDGDWPRRAHDLLEYWTGGGPDAPTDPAHKVPAIADEPIRPDQAGYNAADFRAYFATCALLGGGATLHTETGKHALPPTADEARIAAVALEALNAFPADAPNQPYRRIDEVIDWSVPIEQRTFYSLRSYEVGPYMVRIRPKRAAAYETGWTALDGEGILWRR